MVTVMLNVSAIMGRLTADPELKTTQNGVSVCSFTVAVDRDYVSQGQERQTDFIDVVAWRSTAEFVCRYFSKGSMIAVSGALQSRIFEDKNGNKRKVLELRAEHASFTGERRDTGDAGGSTSSNSTHDAQASYQARQTPQSSSSTSSFEEIMNDDDLPF